MFNRSILVLTVFAMLILSAGNVFAQESQQTNCAIRTDWRTYTVQRGDTLYSIANRAGTDVPTLKAGNCLVSNLIYTGSTLRVPNAINPPVSGPMIDIQHPANGGTLLPNQPFTVSGTAQALFEGNLVVSVRDSRGYVLVETPVTARGDVATGGTGTWSTMLSVNLPVGSTATIYAYATSPRDGSVVASDTTSVTFSSTNPTCNVRTDWATYVVQPGDNLFRIGLRYNTTVVTMAWANCLSNPGQIYVGQVLRVPPR